MTRIRALLIWCACVLAAVVALAAQLLAALFGSGARAHRIAVGFDQTGNAALGGWPDETYSSRCYRTGSEVANVVDSVFGKDHCRQAYHAERRRAQSPVELRK